MPGHGSATRWFSPSPAAAPAVTARLMLRRTASGRPTSTCAVAAATSPARCTQTVRPSGADSSASPALHLCDRGQPQRGGPARADRPGAGGAAGLQRADRCRRRAQCARARDPRTRSWCSAPALSGFRRSWAPASRGAGPSSPSTRIEQRRTLASELGATATIDPTASDTAAVILELTGGAVAAVDTTARPDVLAAAVGVLRERGTLALLGLGALTADLPVAAIMGKGLTVRGVVEGTAIRRPSFRASSMLHRRGELPLDKFVSRYLVRRLRPRAWAAAKAADVVKPVLITGAASLVNPQFHVATTPMIGAAMTPPQLPPGRNVEVRAIDGVPAACRGVRPQDGYPIVLAHGITCAIGVWAHQIADLADRTTASSPTTIAGTAAARPARTSRRLQPQPPRRRPGRGTRRHAEAR